VDLTKAGGRAGAGDKNPNVEEATPSDHPAKDPPIAKDLGGLKQRAFHFSERIASNSLLGDEEVAKLLCDGKGFLEEATRFCTARRKARSATSVECGQHLTTERLVQLTSQEIVLRNFVVDFEDAWEKIRQGLSFQLMPSEQLKDMQPILDNALEACFSVTSGGDGVEEDDAAWGSLADDCAELRGGFFRKPRKVE